MDKKLIPTISKADNYSISFSTKDDGNMLRTNEHRVAIHNNRLNFLAKNNVDPNNLFIIRTSHSPNVEVIDMKENTYIKKTYLQKPFIETDFDHYYTGSDGTITFNSELNIGLISGDCVPLIIWDSVSGMHGILHLGLLGALNNVVRILPKIFAENKVQIQNTNYYLGPSITQKNYDVSNSGLWTAISNQAYDKVSNVKNYIKLENGEEYFDVQQMIIDQILSIGVSNNQIQKYEFCVADEDSIFFSHNILKQKGEKGNFFSVIGGKK